MGCVTFQQPRIAAAGGLHTSPLAAIGASLGTAHLAPLIFHASLEELKYNIGSECQYYKEPR
eukprot:5598515-Pyramimonas_sp.AAC.1